MQLRLLLITILGCYIYKANATDYSLSAEYITMQNGLSDNTVNTILKDKSGFIWFGTSDGLNKYDGFVVKNFQPSDISLNITFLYQCSQGYLWVGTPNELHIFDPLTESFLSHIKLNYEDSNSSVILTGITEDINNSYLITTNHGIAILSFSSDIPSTEFSTVEWINQKNGYNINYEVFNSIIKGTDGYYWLGTNTNMVVRYTADTKQFKSFLLEYSNPNPIEFIITNLNFIDEHLIISTIDNGLYILNTKTGSTKSIAHNKDEKSIISHKDVYGVVKDIYGDFWVATWNGLDQLQELSTNAKANHYNWDHPFFNDKLENRMISILSDPSGVLWIGTHGGGAVKINLEKQYFKRIKFNSLYEVKDFSVDSHQDLYIALYHGGIKKTHLPLNLNSKNTIENFTTHQKGNRHIPTDIILSSATDENENIWFGTIQSSLLYYETKKDLITELKINPENAPDWKGRVEALLIAKDGHFWIGTSNGLILYNRQKNTFILTTSSSRSKLHLSGNYIRALLEDHEGEIWIGTNNGLNKLIYHDSDSLYFNHFNDYYTSPDLLNNKAIWALHEMPDGKLWIGYQSALGYYNSQKSIIQFIQKTDGLCHNFVTCLTHDDKNYLWIGTNSGLSRLNTGNLSFTNYYLANNIRAIFKNEDGQLIFGNNKGLLYFYPDSIKKRNYSPPVYITDIQIQNRSVRVNESINNNIILKKAAPYNTSIELHHPINNLALTYAGLSFLKQKSNKYKYRLVGLDNNWTTADGTQRTVTYNNLKPGKYRFEVCGANSDGIWNNNAAYLNVIIYPVWYMSWWGLILIMLSLTTIILSIYQYRMKLIYSLKDMEIQGKELEHKLDIACIEKNKQQEINELKIRFFTNISHELRTPLTLIMAPAKELITNTSIPDFAKNHLKTIHHQAQNLYDLISQLLDFRKVEVGQMKLHASYNNLNHFTANLIEQFNPVARQKNIKFVLNHTDETIMLWFDIEKLQIILSNIFSNAIKFSPDQGTIKVNLTCLNNKCYISIKDNGPGISEAEQSFIFHRFYHENKKSNTKVAGTGVGLSLAQELTHLHHGKINVKSSPDEGSEFTVILPCGDNHLKEDEKGETYLRTQPYIIDNIAENLIEKKELKQAQASDTKILIVEDHKELLQYINSLLSERFSVQSASNGKEALDLLTDELPDLIISDVMMPMMDGYQLCSTIKKDENRCHIPIILLTAKGSTKDLLDGLETGADDYITKPFNPEVLLAKIDNIVKSRALLRQFYSQKITLTTNNVEIEPHQEQFIRQAMEIVEQNLINPKFNATTLADSLNMSQPTLYRRIKTFTGDNVATFIRSIRIKQAAMLIKSGKYSISETANQVGFSDTAYFRKCFVQQFGVTPSKYKEN